jgi:hypothetical protein
MVVQITSGSINAYKLDFRYPLDRLLVFPALELSGNSEYESRSRKSSHPESRVAQQHLLSIAGSADSKQNTYELLLLLISNAHLCSQAFQLFT